MDDTETEDRRHVAAWRGLAEHVLGELDQLDRDAILRGTHDADKREANIRSRVRARELRALHGLDHMGKMPRNDA